MKNWWRRRSSRARAWFEAALWRFWQRRSLLNALVLPLARLYASVAALRRQRGREEAANTYMPVKAVIGVGNLTVGGSGKTPLTLWLVALLVKAGYRPGILTRGHGRRASEDDEGLWADRYSLAADVGDEPLLLARRTGVPVRVDRDRIRGLQALAHAGIDVVVADDALQHYRLPLSLRLLLVHSQRRFGNGLTLPAGPLREPMAGSGPFDFVLQLETAPDGLRGEKGPPDLPGPVVPAFGFRVRPAAHCLSVNHRGVHRSVPELRGQMVHAVAGIADPDRFFMLLEAHGLFIKRHPFPDHHAFTAADLDFGDEAPVVMTEKDAVKVERLLMSVDPLSGVVGESLGGWWFWPVMVDVDNGFSDTFLTTLRQRMQLHGTRDVVALRELRDRRLPDIDSFH